MRARFIHDGNAIDHTPSSDVAAGDVVAFEDLVGIAKLDIAAGALGALAVSGVFDVAKDTGGGTSIPMGALVYWNPSAQQASTDSSGSVLLGKAVQAAGEDDATVRVRLSQ